MKEVKQDDLIAPTGLKMCLIQLINKMFQWATFYSKVVITVMAAIM